VPGVEEIGDVVGFEFPLFRGPLPGGDPDAVEMNDPRQAGRFEEHA
jgi:hypothetical protein